MKWKIRTIKIQVRFSESAGGLMGGGGTNLARECTFSYRKGACSTNRAGERVQVVGRKARGKETTVKTKM
jgi:hypothetical protein